MEWRFPSVVPSILCSESLGLCCVLISQINTGFLRVERLKILLLLWEKNIHQYNMFSVNLNDTEFGKQIETS